LELPRTNRGLFLLSVPFVLAASSVILLMDGETAADFVNIVVPIMAAIVALLSFLLFWFNRKTPFKSLGFVFLVTFALFALGWAAWTIYTEYVGEVSGIIISDVLWLTGYVMMIFIFAQVIRKTDIDISKRLLLVLAVYWVAMIAILWWAIAPTVSPSDPLLWQNVAYSLYPIFDSILLSELIFLLWIHRKGQLEDVWLFISTAVVFWTVGDVIYLMEEASGNYFVGSLPDVFYLCNYSLLAIGFGLLVSTRVKYTSIVPVAETTVRRVEGTTLAPMRTYVAYGADSKAAYDLVVKNLNMGLEGLIVARRSPNSIRSAYGLKKTAIVWLSTTPGLEVVHPSSLGILTDAVVRFLERSTNAIVLLDGFESLVTYNDFRRALQAIEHIKDTALTHNSRLVLAIDRRTLDPKQVALLEKNSVIVAG